MLNVYEKKLKWQKKMLNYFISCRKKNIYDLRESSEHQSRYDIKNIYIYEKTDLNFKFFALKFIE